MKKIKLFMASPSDTSEEREAFIEVINSIDRSRAAKEGFHLEPVVWEKYAYPEAGNPQVIINKLLDDAEVVVVTFWNKFGAPTEKFPSGTMEELFLAFNKRRATGSPSIKIYFRTPQPPQNVHDVEELKKIFEAKEAIKDLALYKEYKTVEEFKGLLHEHINAWLSNYGVNLSRKSNNRISRHVLKEPSNCREVIKDVFKNIEKKYDGEKSDISFGIEDIDALIGDIADTNLIVVGGDMSSGKTSLMLALAYNTAVINRLSTLYFTTRSSKQDIARNLLSSMSQVNVNNLKNGHLTNEDWPKFTSAAGRLSDLPLFFDDNLKISIDEIGDQAMRLKKSHKLGLIIIDEVNYLSAAKSKIGSELRLLSRDLQLPIVVTAHLTPSKRMSKSLILNDLDTMRDLKKEADMIIFVERKDHGHYDLGRDESKIIIAKNKNGPTMTLEKYYLSEFCSFGGDVNQEVDGY